ncbi:DUF1439 domain-containing protein [Celerinatantimonas sp. YJH-8]|uniref:DUF1439 domain-containing protein n=1 Tax=Celerinatantimonas sp. YJH-8 TaxID=3228714 RepID=UPI0038C67A39
MKKILFLFMLVLPWLSACSMHYTISEQDVTDYLKEHTDYQKTYQLGSLAEVKTDLSQLKVAIGRDDQQRIQLTGTIDLHLKSFIKDMDLTAKGSFAAKPIYNAQEGAVYLTDLDINLDDIQPDQYAMIVNQFLPKLKLSLQAYLQTTPIYQLDKNKTKEAFIKRFAKDVQVHPGSIQLLFKP